MSPTTKRTYGIAFLLFAVSFAWPGGAAAETLLELRLTGLFADYEVEFIGDGIGLNHTLGGLEVGTVLGSGLTLEAGAEGLIGLAGAGWATAIRGGWRYHLHGASDSERNRWVGTLTPLAGLRVGNIPWSSTDDGHGLSTFVLGPQAGIAYGMGRIGPRVGYALRVFTALNYRALSQKRPSAEIWDTYGGDPARMSLEFGVSLGITLPVGR